MSLQLPLKNEWFEMTRDGIKTEDYREITPYWCNRLLRYGQSTESSLFWKRLVDLNKVVDFNGCVNPKPFTQTTLTLGYPKSTDTDRIIKFEHKGIEIREGKPEWGAEKGKLYFVIKHGKKL